MLCDVTPVTNGAEGYMSRYWDCCKPACGWESSSLARPFDSCDINNERLDNFITASACENEDGAYACWKLAPWAACDNLSYGFVAFSAAVCGSCFQFDFTGESHSSDGDPGSAALKGKTMIVQGVDILDASDLGHFQLLIPGGGTHSFSACATQFGTSALGDPDGGFLTACNGDVECVRAKCQQVFGNKPELLAGCEWSAIWFHGADVPAFKFQRVECPEELIAVSGVRP
jgi:hypothetical protein